MPFEFLGDIFGVGNDAAGGGGQAQVNPQGAAGGGQAQNAAMQVQAQMGNGGGMRAAQYINEMDRVFRVEPFGHYVPPIRFRPPDPFDAIQNLASNWLVEGLEFKEIIVSQHTMNQLYNRVQINRPNQAFDREVPTELSINTSMGVVKFICEDSKPKFDLTKYMETVDE